ncbi:hypothetical protein B566_EDAN014326 [Ephemera danica]|nr:hypothetical protein B566_EDAN014326 [Ephemera danica]
MQMRCQLARRWGVGYELKGLASIFEYVCFNFFRMQCFDLVASKSDETLPFCESPQICGYFHGQQCNNVHPAISLDNCSGELDTRKCSSKHASVTELSELALGTKTTLMTQMTRDCTTPC